MMSEATFKLFDEYGNLDHKSKIYKEMEKISRDYSALLKKYTKDLHPVEIRALTEYLKMFIDGDSSYAVMKRQWELRKEEKNDK
jgi:hypothetical protein